MYILQVLASIFNVKIDDLYETPAKTAYEPDAGPSLATFEYQINSAQKIFDDGNIEDAYNRLKMVTGEILAQLTKTTAEHERLKGKLKTAQDVLKL